MSNLNLPDSWTTTTLGTFMDFKNGVNADKHAYGKGIKFVNVMDIFRKNCLCSDDVVGSVEITDKQLNECSVVRGDVLFNRTSETPEEIAFSSVYLGEEKITFGGFVIRGRQTKPMLLPEFAKYCFKTDKIRKEMIRRSQGAVRANIGQKDLSKIPIVIPPETDQKMIVSILDEWGHMIEKTEALIDAKERQFGWLKSKLLLKNPNAKHWKTKTLGHYIEEKKDKSTVPDLYPCLTSSRRGMFLQDEYFSKQVASKDNTGYKIMSRGDFTYRSMSDDGTFVFNKQDIVDKGLISPAYGVFSPNKYMDADFLYYFLNSSAFKRVLVGEVQGGTRTALKLNALKKLDIDIPELTEQQAIANKLNTGNREINLLKKLAEQYRTQKRGLMQKLLSGEWQIKKKETT